MPKQEINRDRVLKFHGATVCECEVFFLYYSLSRDVTKTFLPVFLVDDCVKVSEIKHLAPKSCHRHFHEWRKNFL